jgi:hypothetical protein
VFGPLAAASGVSVEQLLTRWADDQTLLGRLPTLAQVADTAVFLASDRTGAITGAVIDLSCGSAIRVQPFGHALIGVLHQRYLPQSSSDSATSSRCESPSAANRCGREGLVGCAGLVVMVALRGRVTIICARRADLDAPKG